MFFGRAGPLLVHLQGREGEWRDDEDDDFDIYEADSFDIDIFPSAICLKPKVEKDACSICLGDMDAEEKTKLKCGHEFCDECLSSYLVHQLRSREVTDGQESKLEPRTSQWSGLSHVHLSVRKFCGVRCPSYGCQSVLNEDLIESLIDEPAKQIFQTTIREFIERERIRQMNIFSHVELGRWARKINAKCCPKCFVPIEKHLGCDHMHCFSCKHHFLWSQAPLFGTNKHWWREDKIPE